MMILISCAVLFVAFPATLGMMTPTQKYPFHKSMNAQGSYQLYWEYDSHMITFEIIANTTGFVGLGWSPKGSMVQADIIVASVSDRDGRLELMDCHGPPAYNGKPNCTEESNLIPVASKQQNSYTMVKFRRKLDTCDDPDDRPITGNTMRMIWAMGKTDVLEHHGSNRGSRSMRLIGIDAQYTDLPAGYKTFDMVQQDFTIPPKETHYECIFLELPKLKDKHHVIRIDPIIKTPDNVHHIVLKICDLEVNNKTKYNPTAFVNKSAHCGSSGEAINGWKCSSPMFGWAVGGESFNLPKEAGLPIGSNKEPYYAKLAIHYDNPRLVRNVKDSSGLRLIYTDQLRKNDAGAIVVGKMINENQIIPPRQSNFVSYVYSLKECTSSNTFFGNESNVTLFAVFPHSHYAGRAIRHRHFRNGYELPYLYDDQAYDFDYQNWVLLSKEVSFQRGDQFAVECTYNTQDRSNATLGGRSTREEMCLSYVLMYPRIPLSIMTSYTNERQVKELYENNRKNGLPQSRSTLKSNIKWGTDGRLAKWWQNVERKQEKHFAVCQTRGVKTNVMRFTDKYPPKIMNEYKPKPSPCHPITHAAASTNPWNPVLMSFAMLLLILVNLV